MVNTLGFCTFHEIVCTKWIIRLSTFSAACWLLHSLHFYTDWTYGVVKDKTRFISKSENGILMEYFNSNTKQSIIWLISLCPKQTYWPLSVKKTWMIFELKVAASMKIYREILQEPMILLVRIEWNESISFEHIKFVKWSFLR